MRQLIRNLFVAECDMAARLSEDAAKRFRRQQMRGAIEQMRVFVVGNTLFAPVLSFQAWNVGINPIVIAWSVVMLVFSWWLFLRWRTSYHTDGSLLDMQKFIGETRLNSGLWCMGMVLFYPHVDGDQKTIITTVMAGSLALGTVGFSQAPAAAFWYLAIQATTMTLVPLTYGISHGSGTDILISLLGLVASVAIFNAILELGRRQRKAFIKNEELAQKSEVIDLLLKDYEEQGIEWLWQTDAAGRLINGPRPVLNMLEIEVSPDQPLPLIPAIQDNIGPDGQNDLQRVERAFRDQTDFHDVTLPLFNHATSQSHWIMMRGRPQYDGDTFIGFRGIFADATTTVKAKRQVEHLADHDSLTGTYNRNAVQSRLEKMNTGDDRVMVFLIDLDGFKQVNDSYGHAIGDELLKIMAKRLEAAACHKDLVARLGGDEFIIIVDLAARNDSFDPDDFADTILRTLATPYLIRHFDIALSASIGTARLPEDTEIGTNLLIQADLALYVAKQSGRNRCCAFEESMQIGLQKRLIVTERLKKAVLSDDIIAYYQPQYCTKTRELIGFEALARWIDPELGTVGPDIFIPIAEETGLIHQLGAQMLHTACVTAKGWMETYDDPDLVISVNLSPVQVTRGNIVKTVQTVLDQTGLPADRLEIEITEGVLINDMQSTRDILKELSKLGIRVALDDFGTGYSSLSYIRALPLDRLKIDRSFVSDLDDPEAQSIVRTIIALCNTLGLSVIAEGVETQDCLEILTDMKCDVLQGYYFAAPLPKGEAQALLAQKHEPVLHDAKRAG